MIIILLNWKNVFKENVSSKVSFPLGFNFLIDVCSYMYDVVLWKLMVCWSVE